MNRSGKSILKWLGVMYPRGFLTTRSPLAGTHYWLDECSSIPNGPPSELLPMSTTPILPELAAAQLTGKTSPSDLEWRKADLVTSENGVISASSARVIQLEEERSLSITDLLNFSGDLYTIKQSSLKSSELWGLMSNALSLCAGPAIHSRFEAIQMKSSTPSSSTSTASSASQERLTRDEMFIEMAHTAAKRGTCNRLKVGAVLVEDNRPISIGYNGTPPGAAHCGPECTAANPCTKTLHAEANAIDWAVKNYSQSELDESILTLYVTDSPCMGCATKIYLAGITRVVYDRAYRIRDGIEFLEKGGVEVTQCHVKPATSAN